MDNDNLKTYESGLNEFLADTFRKHNIDCEIKEDIVVFPKQRITASTALVNRSSSSSAFILQLDVKFEIGQGRTIIESYAGLGMSMESAVSDTWKNFMKYSFHTLLAAFFSNEFEEQIEREQWLIGQQPYEVIISHSGIRGDVPKPFSTQWFDQLKTLIKSQQLSYDTHWIKLYYAQSENEPISLEILLDNEVWRTVEKEVQSFSFPHHKEFYSIRILIIIKKVADIDQVATTTSVMANENKEPIGKESKEKIQVKKKPFWKFW